MQPTMGASEKAKQIYGLFYDQNWVQTCIVIQG
jgi:hypothetical protein